MATLVVYSKASDGYVFSFGTDYSTTRAGDNVGVVTVGTGNYCGQDFSDPNYWLYETFMQYDTSSLTSLAVVSAVKEELYLKTDYTTTDYTEEVRTYDWGAELTVADYVAGANLGNYTLLSSKAVSPSAGYNEFSTSANFIAAINTTGDTRLFHSSSRQRAGNVPFDPEFVEWYSTDETGTDKDPKLTITYTLAAEGGAESVVNISAIGGGYEALYGGALSTVNITAIGGGNVLNILRFLEAPTVDITNPIATHVIVTSPTNTYTAHTTPEAAAADMIERAVTISEGNATVCQTVAEALIARWGVEQITVSGKIPLTLILDFKQYVHIQIPYAGIDADMQLQRKIHTIESNDTYTSVVLGTVYVGENELIARILEEIGS